MSASPRTACSLRPTVHVISHTVHIQAHRLTRSEATKEATAGRRGLRHARELVPYRVHWFRTQLLIVRKSWR
jgi:hypothetical protein